MIQKRNIWKCDQCNKDNGLKDEECSGCGNNRPEIPNIIEEEKKNEEKKKILIAPVLLLQLFNDQVVYNDTSGDQILKAYEPNIPIVVINSAGVVGTGKSTWMNTLIYEFTKQDTTIEFSNFSIGHGNKSHTEGLWVYPYAFRLPNINAQFMLCDMEGMEGIKNIDHKILMSGLKKLYTFGMIISSNFVLHTHRRPDSKTISTLKEAHSITKRLINVVKFDPPKIFLTVQDSSKFLFGNGNNINENNDIKEFKDTLKISHDIGDEIFEYFEILPKPKPPTDFLTSLEEGIISQFQCFEFLENSDYLKFSQNFLQKYSQNEYIKKKPMQKEAIDIKSLISLWKNLAQIINSNNFENFFKESLDRALQNQMKPIANNLLEEFKAKSSELVQQTSEKENLEFFENKLHEIRKVFSSKYEDEMNKLTNRKASELDFLKNEYLLFKNALKDNEAQMKFIIKQKDSVTAEQRKKLEETQEILRKEQKDHANTISNLTSTNERKMASLEGELAQQRSITQKMTYDFAQEKQKIIDDNKKFIEEEKKNPKKECNNKESSTTPKKDEKENYKNQLNTLNTPVKINPVIRCAFKKCPEIGKHKCGVRKTNCNKLVCDKHYDDSRCETCNRTFCSEHYAVCYNCNKATCKEQLEDGSCYRNLCKQKFNERKKILKK